MINSSKMLMIFGACVFSGQLPAFGEMTADEAITLISGNTVDGERRDGGVPGVDASGKIENFATPFSLYFDSNGTLRKKTGGKPKIGKWRVSDDSGLCMKWKGKKEKCAPIHKQGNVYRRVVRRKNGFILYEHTYIGIIPGNKYKL